MDVASAASSSTCVRRSTEECWVVQKEPPCVDAPQQEKLTSWDESTPRKWATAVSSRSSGLLGLTRPCMCVYVSLGYKLNDSVRVKGKQWLKPVVALSSAPPGGKISVRYSGGDNVCGNGVKAKTLIELSCGSTVGRPALLRYGHSSTGRRLMTQPCLCLLLNFPLPPRHSGCVTQQQT